MSLRFAHIEKSFGTQRVLDGVTLAVEPGEIVFIVGESGAGKSLLARMSVGLVAPDAGRLWVDEREVTGIDAAAWEDVRRQCQLVFQQAPLLDGASVLENVEIPLRRRMGLKHRAAQVRALELLEELHIADTAALYPPALGAGVRKQVAIARALALEPRVLVYDEPTTGLDPVAARRTDRLIRDVGRKSGMTTLVVSHDLTSVSEIGERVAFLHRGRIHFDGAPPALWESSDPAVRAFLDAARNPSALC